MLKFFKRKPKKEDFLVLEIGLERITCALFKREKGTLQLIGVGRKKFFGQEEVFDATLEALDALAAIVPDFPRRGILGVSGGSLQTTTTLARYDRPKPKHPISHKETEEALSKVVENLEVPGKKIFFSTIANARIDGVKVTNPIGLKGEKVELSCFAAVKTTEEINLLDRLIAEIDLTVEKIIPTSFAIASMLERKNLKNALIYRAGVAKSEFTILIDGHVAEIFPVDLGTEEPELLPFAWQAALKDVEKSSAPALVWLFSDNDEVLLEPLKGSLLSFSWKERLGFEITPKIEIAGSVHNFSPSDMGIFALSQGEVVNETT
jgi:hypothetical protein